MTALDIVIFNTNNCKTLGVIDSSIYSNPLTVAEPTITLWTPGTNTYVTTSILPGKVNILNSNTLNLTCSDTIEGLINLPDGFYKIKYTVKPSATYSVEKTFLRICKLRSKYESALLKLDVYNCNDQERKLKLGELKEIEFLMITAQAAATICNQSLALKLYKKADKKLDQYGQMR